MKAGMQIWRDENGVAHVEAQSKCDLCWGQGFVHATDRGMQMLLMRILGQGRVCEILDSSDTGLEIDVFFRRMNWSELAPTQIDLLTPDAKSCLQAYCDGANAALLTKVPWEFRLLRYRPTAWRIEDIILLLRMVGYLTLQESQAAMERLLIELVQRGISRNKLEELFPGALVGLDIDLLQRVEISDRVIPSTILWGSAIPRPMASNNWVVAGQKTASSRPMLASDVHLEGNRLPSVWYEIALHWEDNYAIGGSIPGGPGILNGRTREIAWSPTYAFMDSVDSWIELCRDGRYYREPDQWPAFRQRRELIRRKNKTPVEVAFYENDHGVLDGDATREGYYLATRWAAAQSGAATWCQLLGMWDVKNVEQGMQTLGKVETCWNWLLVDRDGNIGYQMSGLLPKRREGISGLVPLPGWKAENDWQGFVGHEELPRSLNPDQGYFATANDDLNRFGVAKPINLPMGPYRADHIRNLLGDGRQLRPHDMFQMQFDVYSLQAEMYMKVLEPLLPSTPQGETLRRWDCRYTADSRGAFLFEQFYWQLYRDVFGRGGLGEEAVDHLIAQTGIFVDFYANFDRVLLAETSAWFGDQPRDELYKQAAAKALRVEPRTWGETRQYMMRHLLLGGRLPRFLGFDRGPITAIGGRATIHQGQVYRSGNRETTFVPSFRLVTDLSKDEVYTTLQGGPSDRRFSRWYCSDLENWLSGRYKTVSADKTQQRTPFP